MYSSRHHILGKLNSLRRRLTRRERNLELVMPEIIEEWGMLNF